MIKLSASANANELCEWVWVGIHVYILHHKYQFKPHSSPWFSAAFAAVKFIETTFFICTNRLDLLNVKESSERLVIVAKGFLKLSNLRVLIKQKRLSLLRNLVLGTFGKLPIVFSTKLNLLYLLYSTVSKCSLLHLIKQNCVLKTFLRTLILMA